MFRSLLTTTPPRPPSKTKASKEAITSKSKDASATKDAKDAKEKSTTKLSAEAKSIDKKKRGKKKATTTTGDGAAGEEKTAQNNSREDVRSSDEPSNDGGDDKATAVATGPTAVGDIARAAINAELPVLLKKTWYHGLMPRDEIEDLIKKDGDYIVRMTDVSKSPRIVISVRWTGRARHILLILNAEKRWATRNEPGWETIEKLVTHFVTSKQELQPDGTKLMQPIKRPSWYILHDHVNIKKRLGAGSFGDVFLATLHDEDDTDKEVAVKMLKGKMGKVERVQFVREASINRKLVHPNCVRLLGVASQQEPIMVVSEFLSGGALKNHIAQHPQLTIDTLTKYLIDAAKGLQYLSDQNVIHRDIAARNCLISANDIVKISDFGLSVCTKEVNETKWLAPETLLRGQFTTKTDVWSYGVMMWEVYERCKTDPYPGSTNAEVRAIVCNSRTLDCPTETPSHAAPIMKACWKMAPEERPTFSRIVTQLSTKVMIW